MMNKLFLSWSIAQKGGSRKSNCWDDIANLLDDLRLSNGSVTVDRLDDENYLITEIQVRMEKDFYLVTFMNEDDEVMSIIDLTQPDEKILILGDYWPAGQLTKDFDLVVRIFREFFDTGNVSKNLLN
ncbi:hypothetical protein N5580_04100 [Pantoea piersonii]|uniref:Uncharacterized protein n=1 Tax=Pantoea piersonii TaxID=2364647 RepID=A0AAJ5UAX9_9GAMM|nr:hypothetical protein [Pantoea piersonii]WBG91745.1 hypothetical protein N5580_04100 [Pantoea piersonii]